MTKGTAWRLTCIRGSPETTEACGVAALRVEGMACHQCQLLVAQEECRPPGGVVDLLSAFALIAVDGSQATAADGAVEQQHVRVGPEAEERCLELVGIVDVIDVAHRQAGPAVGLLAAVAEALEQHRHAEGRHELLLDVFVGCVLTHRLAHLAVLLGAHGDNVIILDETDDLCQRLQRAGVGAVVREQRQA